MPAQELVPAFELNANFAGKPAFFDSERGLKWDGQNAFLYADAPSHGLSQFVGDNLPRMSESTTTALETQGFVVGNGTEGNLADHRAGVHSVYLLDSVASAPLVAGLEL